MRIGVIITSRNDVRLIRTLESLGRQSLGPTNVVVADGSDEEWLSKHNLRAMCREVGATWLHSEGSSVPQARNLALENLEDVDVVAFLDTDEYAPESWLANLTEAIVKDQADFTGGPTNPIGERTRYAEYLENIEERHYQLVSQDVSALPMGNSAWRREIFETIGGFDESFVSAGEDYDINLRALNQGYRGLFVLSAWVYHDQSYLETSWKILKRKYRYMVGGAMAYRKNRTLIEKVGRIVHQPKYWHWLEFFNPPLRILAYLKAKEMMK